MNHTTLIFGILSAAIILAQGTSFVQLGGSGGTTLLQSLTNNSTTIMNSNNTTINLSRAASAIQLEGTGGNVMFENLTNSSSSDGANGTMDDLNSWGRKLRPLGPPPRYDAEAARMAEMNVIIRQNHLGY